MLSNMRSLTAPFVAAPPAGARIRTRLRVGTTEAQVLLLVGEHLGSLAGLDVAVRCQLGHGDDQRTTRKQALTACSSSRWAGSVTRTSNDQWQRGFMNLLDAQVGLRRAIKAIRARLRVPVGKAVGRGRGRVRGYARPSLAELRQQPSFALDLNADHLAGWVLDPSGNPVGAPATIPLALEGLPATTRDGRLRHAVAEAIRAATAAGCQSMVVENLDFADARHTGRERLGRAGAASGSAAPSTGSPPGRSATCWWGWPPTRGCGWWRWTRPTPPGGAASTGRRL